MKIGYIGLGKMGKNMVLRLLDHAVEVVAWNRSPEPLEEVVLAGAIKSNSLEDLCTQLGDQKIIWLMLPAKDPTDEVLSTLMQYLEPGDLIIDGANAFYKDTLRRHKLLEAKGIHFIDVAVSGGPLGARNGACLMIGGNQESVLRITPLLKTLAAPESYAHLGPTGAGHFAKMIHNGIEYGMMQAIAEGASILQQSSFQFDLAKVFSIYNNHSVIESRLVGWTQEIFKENPSLNEVSSKIGHLGEGEWTIQTAKEMKLEVPVIEQSFQVRIESTQKPENFRNKVVSALRGKFGGHSIHTSK